MGGDFDSTEQLKPNRSISCGLDFGSGMDLQSFCGGFTNVATIAWCGLGLANYVVMNLEPGPW